MRQGVVTNWLHSPISLLACGKRHAHGIAMDLRVRRCRICEAWSIPSGRARHVRADARAVSHLPQHHRQWFAAEPCEGRRVDSSDDPRGRNGNEVFDWTVPKEWNIRDAYIKDAAGRRVVDFRRSNLHVVNYSAPVSARMSLRELRPHLHVLPEHPDWIPYRTSYYAESWGFCLSQRQLESLAEGEYEVVINSTLQDGSLTYGECVLPGQIEDEFLISVHICHPSLANDNLSGVAVATALAKILASTSHRYTYRFLFVPGTIGPIAWLFGIRMRRNG